MLSLRIGSAVHASHISADGWNPQCHWIVHPEDTIAAEFVESLLDKYGPGMKAYAITPLLGGCFCVELQFVDPILGRQCNLEYVQGWRKGGAVAREKKAANIKAGKRLFRHRMYVLPDGTEFCYFGRWDGHGNLIGKVLTDAGYSPDEEGIIPIENRIVHRSVVEQGFLVPKGEQRFCVGN
jgi:hypothetical protein